MEELPRESTCNYLVQPKLEALYELEITYEYEDQKDIKPKVELPSIGSHKDQGVNEHNVEMVMPIKTQHILCDDILQLRRQMEKIVSDREGSLEQTKADIKSEPVSKSNEDAACVSTYYMTPFSTRLATNSKHEVQAEEAETLQSSVKGYNIEIGSNRPFHTSSITVMDTAFGSCHSECNIDTASKDSNYHMLTQNEDIGQVTTEVEVNKCKVSKCVQSETNCSNVLIGTSSFTCDICKKSFKLRKYIVKHMKTHSDIKLFNCKFCPFESEYKDNLTIHMRAHKKLYQCELCVYNCATSSRLVLHMRSHNGEKPYCCKLCHLKFARKYNLVRHMSTHTGEKPFSCNLCKYTCTENSNLVRHMRTHNGDRPYSCKLCDYKSATKSQLVIHIRTHTGEKPFLCKLCTYRCAAKGDLLKHIRTHTGEKPFGCKLCKYTCTANCALVKHVRTHSGERPYSCELCDYKCARNSNLVQHMKTHM